MNFRLRHLVAALALHLVLLGVLAGGVQCSARPVQPPVITGVLLDPSRQETARRKREEQRRQAAEAERQRREEQARLQREADARKKAEAEAKKKKDAEALRQKQLADKKAAEKKAADQRAAEQKKKAEDAARKKEQERLEREAAAKREAAERARVEQAMQEEAARREAEQAAQALAEDQRLGKIAQWAEALAAHVRSFYSRPPGTPDTYACKVRMQLLPDGTVTGVSIVKSCGSPLVDQAVMAAVRDSSPMPLPADRSVFDPDLTINFSP